MSIYNCIQTEDGLIVAETCSCNWVLSNRGLCLMAIYCYFYTCLIILITCSTINNNTHKLKEFASVNEFKIKNTFFRHKKIHKMTWSARGYRSIIDYILTNKKLSPLINDTKVFRGYDVSTDHYLLISKIC